MLLQQNYRKRNKPIDKTIIKFLYWKNILNVEIFSLRSNTGFTIRRRVTIPFAVSLLWSCINSIWNAWLIIPTIINQTNNFVRHIYQKRKSPRSGFKSLLHYQKLWYWCHQHSHAGTRAQSIPITQQNPSWLTGYFFKVEKHSSPEEQSRKSTWLHIFSWKNKVDHKLHIIKVYNFELFHVCKKMDL